MPPKRKQVRVLTPDETARAGQYEAMRTALEKIQWIYGLDSIAQWRALNPGRTHGEFCAAAAGRILTIADVALDGLPATGATADWREAVEK